MYIHFIAPDPKFPELIRRLFLNHTSDQEHRFVILAPKSARETFGPSFDYFETVDAFQEWVDFTNCEGVLLHGLLNKASPFLEIIPENIKVAWFIWGYEIYRTVYPKNRGLLDPATNRFSLSRRRELKRSILKGPFAKLDKNQRREQKKQAEAKESLERIDFVVTQIEEEFHLLRKLGYLTERHRWINVPVLELQDLVGANSPPTACQGPDVQVGNSASPANNHVDVFQRLASYDLGTRKIIVPLSYGSEEYRNFVLKKGRQILGPNFHPITTFMPLDEYLKLFRNCSTSIFNHHRQQAVGNVVAALWQGRRVYLGRGPILPELAKQGLPVFSFDKEFQLDRDGMSEVELESCRAKLEARLGPEAVASRVTQLLRQLQS